MFSELWNIIHFPLINFRRYSKVYSCESFFSWSFIPANDSSIKLSVHNYSETLHTVRGNLNYPYLWRSSYLGLLIFVLLIFSHFSFLQVSILGHFYPILISNRHRTHIEVSNVTFRWNIMPSHPLEYVKDVIALMFWIEKGLRTQFLSFLSLVLTAICYDECTEITGQQHTQTCNI